MATSGQRPSQRQPGIRAFARTTKPVSIGPDEKTTQQPQQALKDGESVSPLKDRNEEPSLKRLRGELKLNQDAPPKVSPAKRLKLNSAGANASPHNAQFRTPTKRRGNPQCLPTPGNTPRRQTSTTNEECAGTDFDQANSVELPESLPTTDFEVAGLPAKLHDLIQLNSSLLKALSLHFAHHGTTSPLDVRLLTPSVSKIWGKRRVSLEDVRRSLGVLYSHTVLPDATDLQLFDYDGGRVCLETTTKTSSKPQSPIVRPLDEEKLNAVFWRNLRTAWKRWRKQQSSTADSKSTGTIQTTSLPGFIASLPLAPTPRHPSAEATASFPNLGQQRLHGLKHPPQNFAKLPTPPNPSQDNSTHIQKKSLHSRHAGLMDRLKNKQARSTALPEPPTRASLDHKAALHRVPEIARILSVLAGGAAEAQQRRSYSMGALVQQVQESMRGGAGVVGKEEVERCLRVLDEGSDGPADGLVKVVRIGKGDAGVLGVVLDARRMPNFKALEAWVDREVSAEEKGSRV